MNKEQNVEKKVSDQHFCGLKAQTEYYYESLNISTVISSRVVQINLFSFKKKQQIL